MTQKLEMQRDSFTFPRGMPEWNTDDHFVPEVYFHLEKLYFSKKVFNQRRCDAIITYFDFWIAGVSFGNL